MSTGIEEIAIPGLAEPVDVRIDSWGVPHLTASCAADLYRAQGYVAARDRLFQLDLWRRQGLGLLSEAFGSAFVERDRAARLFLYRGDMESEWAAYSGDARAVCRAFVEGVNAFIAATLADPALLPPEFRRWGHRPQPWRADDVCRIRVHGLWHNATKEWERAMVWRDFGHRVEDLRQQREPWAPVRAPEGLDLSVLDDRALDVYRLALSPLALPGASDTPAPPPASDGSNNWALAPARTVTGRALLASDPHRSVQVPSNRYLIHLTCPEFDVIGAGEPMLPGVSLGHNGHVAFCLTISPADQEDVYVYELNPEDDTLYRYGDGWEEMTLLSEAIAPSDAPPAEVELRFTRHGPVTWISDDRRTAVALRATWLGPAHSPYLASLRYQRAQNVDEFMEALDQWQAPPVNHVFADTSGRIGWAMRGALPIRPTWDGSMPVPGDGRHEWQGLRLGRDLPSVLDPEVGVVATANQHNFPDTEPWLSRPPTRDWQAGFRHQRIREAIDEQARWTVAETAALQNDYLSIPARELLALIDEHGGLEEDGLEAEIDLLRNWDHRMSADSAGAALFQRWFRRHLRPAVLRSVIAATLPAERVEDALARIDPYGFFGDPRADLSSLRELAATSPDRFRTVISSTFASAVRELRELLGEDPAAWQWGKLHRTRFVHPGGVDAHSEEGPWSLPAKPKHGSPDNVGVAYADPEGNAVIGASFRMVVDLGSWDESLAINAPGQSGVPGSPHYDDLRDLWQEDGTFPLLYSSGAVEASTAQRLRLRPGRGER